MLLLILSSALMYFFFLHRPILNLNTVLVGGVGDSLKNYFTFIFHTKHAQNLLHFHGMNFPYGEHVVFTDNVPLLSFVLHYLPFTHHFLVAIFNAVMILSLMVTPVIIYKTFQLLGFTGLPAILCALAVAVLCPQYYKITAGHYALTYTWVIPGGLLLLLRHMKGRQSLWPLFTYILLLFFVHPYFGFGVAAFSFLALVTRIIMMPALRRRFPAWIKTAACTVVPVVVFIAFVNLTDTHQGRPDQPHGLDMYAANAGSLLFSFSGPLAGALIGLVDAPSFESYSYLGVAIILFTVILFGWSIFRKKFAFHPDTTGVFVASIILLAFAFGLYSYFHKQTGIRISPLEQLRATGRFAWFFYFVLPLIVLPAGFRILAGLQNPKRRVYVAYLVAALFFGLNFLEAYNLVKPDEHVWGKKNIFHHDALTPEEKSIVATVREQSVTAIIAVPFFHSGSEIYHRDDPQFGTTEPVMYSYHTGLPLLSSMLSRTSLSESANIINMYGSYDSIPFRDNEKFLVVHYKGRMKPDDERLVAATDFFYRNDLYQLGWLSAKAWQAMKRPVIKDTLIVTGENPVISNGSYFLAAKPDKPFLPVNMKDFSLITVADASQLRPGRYAVSLHYYPSRFNWDGLDCNLIVSETKGSSYEWKYNLRLRSVSAVRDSFVIFEDEIEIKDSCKYDFLMYGIADLEYRISNFLLRPIGSNVLIRNGGNTLVNNFPVR
jgi:hypothetical protein